MYVFVAPNEISMQPTSWLACEPLSKDAFLRCYIPNGLVVLLIVCSVAFVFEWFLRRREAKKP